MISVFIIKWFAGLRCIDNESNCKQLKDDIFLLVWSVQLWIGHATSLIKKFHLPSVYVKSPIYWCIMNVPEWYELVYCMFMLKVQYTDVLWMSLNNMNKSAAKLRIKVKIKEMRFTLLLLQNLLQCRILNIKYNIEQTFLPYFRKACFVFNFTFSMIFT